LPHHKSTRKRLRQNQERRLRNRAERSHMRAQLRSFRSDTAAGTVSAAPDRLSAIYSLLDRKVRKGVIHHRKADRLKSRLAALAAEKSAPAE
jgi:small subunit ribosomal protein S20